MWFGNKTGVYEDEGKYFDILTRLFGEMKKALDWNEVFSNNQIIVQIQRESAII